MDKLPPILLERVRLCACERRVPPEIPLMVGLAAVAACAGPGIEIKSGGRRTTRANLFVLLGVSSGIGKSEVFRDMLDPLLTFETSLHRWWEEEPSAKARAGEELLKARIAGMRTKIRKLQTGNIMVMFERLQKSERARAACQNYLSAPCLLADDSTSEALARLMHLSNESVATVSADARYLLKRLGTPDTKEESFFLKGFSGDLTMSHRISRNSVRLRRPCLTTLLLTQQDAYSKFMEKAVMNRSGLLPRFLHAAIGNSEHAGAKVDGRRASRIRSEYTALLTGIIESYRFETSPALALASPAAKKFIAAIEDECRTKAKYDEGLEGEVLRRRAEQTWRVSLCLHLARHGNAAALHPLSQEDAETAYHIATRFS